SIDYAPRIPGVDLIITGRGGGSLEDLWAFNEEIVARSIFACPIPVISAVGHEIDVSISDLVADRRALTPSEAAELAVPSGEEVEQTLRGLRSQLVSALKNRAARARMQLEHWSSRPVYERPMQRIDELRQRLDDWNQDLDSAMKRAIEQRHQMLSRESIRLDSLSPLNVLKRGYSITSRIDEHKALTETAQLKPGDRLKTVLHQGEFLSEVTEILPQ
ncbi:MAG TPA: exodeoxyribonuclease VII large subunit, partial [Planctomycetaceae bacterium]|nr:exodeoxyribonuclease VII large subunit [Planctomycetaceae bacterium]